MNNSRSTSPPLVFVGSSGESKDVAIGFSVELKAQGAVCHVKRWDQLGVFEPSGTTLQTLISEAGEVDFAVFVAAPDDVTMSRDSESRSVRDNVLFEFALFVGILGQDRTYLLTEKGTPLKLPSDIAGLTTVYYDKLSTDPVANHDAFTAAAAGIRYMIQKLGRRGTAATPTRGTPAGDTSNRVTPASPASNAHHTRKVVEAAHDTGPRAMRLAMGGTEPLEVFRVVNHKLEHTWHRGNWSA